MTEPSTPCDFCIIGLGKIGSNLARQALEKKIRVAGYTLRRGRSTSRVGPFWRRSPAS